MSETKIDWSRFGDWSAMRDDRVQALADASSQHGNAQIIHLLARLRDEIARREKAEIALGQIETAVCGAGWTHPEDVVGRVRQDVAQAKQSQRQMSAVLDEAERDCAVWKQRAEKAEAELAQAREAPQPPSKNGWSLMSAEPDGRSCAIIKSDGPAIRINNMEKQDFRWTMPPLDDVTIKPSETVGSGWASDLVEAYRRVIRDLAAQSGG